MAAAKRITKNYEITTPVQKPIEATGLIDSITNKNIWITEEWLLLKGEHTGDALAEVILLSGFNFDLAQYGAWLHEYL